MTKGEAVVKLKQYLNSNTIEDISGNEGLEGAIGMAIEALGNAPNVLEALDCISRQAAINALCKRCDLVSDDEPCTEECNDIKILKLLPSAQPEPISEAYAKTVFTWLLDYQVKAAELKGRYTPYEVLSWVANDWRKENEIN